MPRRLIRDAAEILLELRFDLSEDIRPYRDRRKSDLEGEPGKLFLKDGSRYRCRNFVPDVGWPAVPVHQLQLLLHADMSTGCLTMPFLAEQRFGDIEVVQHSLLECRSALRIAELLNLHFGRVPWRWSGLQGISEALPRFLARSPHMHPAHFARSS